MMNDTAINVQFENLTINKLLFVLFVLFAVFLLLEELKKNKMSVVRDMMK